MTDEKLMQMLSEAVMANSHEDHIFYETFRDGKCFTPKLINPYEKTEKMLWESAMDGNIKALDILLFYYTEQSRFITSYYDEMLTRKGKRSADTWIGKIKEPHRYLQDLVRMILPQSDATGQLSREDELRIYDCALLGVVSAIDFLKKYVTEVEPSEDFQSVIFEDFLKKNRFASDLIYLMREKGHLAKSIEVRLNESSCLAPSPIAL